MRRLCSTVLLCLVVLACFGLVAVERYAWQSWEAYTLVRTWELVAVIVLAALLFVVSATTRLWDWCVDFWYSRMHKATKTASASAPYTPLDIADPDGRFGKWMPGDDPDDWR